MPYKSLSDANPSIRGIRPRVTLEQANEIANVADTIAKTNPDGAWAIAIAQFKKLHTVRGGRWVKRQKSRNRESADKVYREYGEGLRGHKPAPDLELDEMDDDEPVAEAATYKTKCQALIRDMASIMADRTLPAPMRTALGHIQSELKRTWADLEKDGTTTEESMGEQLSEVTKTVGGKTFPSSDFLVVENPDEPSTWHLQVMDHGKADHRLMGAAMAALTSSNGFRGNKYEGPKKAEALRKLKAMYKAEDMEMPAMEAATRENGYDMPMAMPSMMPMGATSFADLDAAENAQDAAQEVNRRVYQFQDLVRNALADMTITDKVAAIKKIADEFVALIGELMADPTAPTTESAAIAEGEALAESESGAAFSLVEETATNDGVRAPVTVDFVMIKPGAGNKKDMHWYPADVLKRDAHVFENADIFATDHRDNERSERTKVGKVKAITGFNEQGAPIARTIIFDPDMAEKTRNRAQAGELATLECSILGQGVAKPKDIDGTRYNVVEAITKGIALELVSKAGAGGHALNIQESSQGGETVNEPNTTATPPASGTPPVPAAPATAAAATAPAAPVAEAQPAAASAPAAPVLLAEAEIKRIVGETNLPDVAKARLTERQFKDEKELREAITTEIEYVKKLTGAGKPTNLGSTTPAGEQRISEADYQKRLEDIDRKYGLR